MTEATTQFPHCWGKINYIFQPAIVDESGVRETFTNEGTEQVMRAAEIRDGLAQVIDRIQAEVGMQKIHILAAEDSQRNIFAQALKSDKDWFSGYSAVLKLFGVENDPQSILPHINRPWWNSLQVNLSQDNYQEGVYSFKGPVSHSFIAQLKPVGIEARTTITPGVQEKFQPLSVGGSSTYI